MTDKWDVRLAKMNFNNLCAVLDENNWKYEKNSDEFLIECKARGENLPMDIRIKVNTQLKIVTFFSPMNFNVSDLRRKNLAIAVARANYCMVDGNFDYKYTSGKILFRLTASYDNCVLSKEAFKYIIFTACNTVDKYNGLFLSVSQNDMTIGGIIKTVE